MTTIANDTRSFGCATCDQVFCFRVDRDRHAEDCNNTGTIVIGTIALKPWPGPSVPGAILTQTPVTLEAQFVGETALQDYRDALERDALRWTLNPDAWTNGIRWQ